MARKIVLCITACVMLLFVTACGNSSTFRHGSWDGNTYTSKFLGLKLELDSYWIMTSDETLAKAAGISDMSDSNILTVFNNGGTISEMSALGSGGSSVSITVQDNDTSETPAEEDFISESVAHLKADFDASGFENTVEKDTVRFLGKDTDCIYLAYTAYNISSHELIIPIFKSHYTAVVTFSADSRSGLNTLVGMTSAV